jgi:hypothetical protein
VTAAARALLGCALALCVALAGLPACPCAPEGAGHGEHDCCARPVISTARGDCCGHGALTSPPPASPDKAAAAAAPVLAAAPVAAEVLARCAARAPARVRLPALVLRI